LTVSVRDQLPNMPRIGTHCAFEKEHKVLVTLQFNVWCHWILFFTEYIRNHIFSLSLLCQQWPLCLDKWRMRSVNQRLLN